MEDAASLRRSVWTSSILTLVGLALFIGISAVIPSPTQSLGRILLGVFLALVPAVIWLVFFYQQDRSEPEPKQLMARVFAFGAIAAAALAVPLTAQLFDHTINELPSVFLRLLATTLSVSLLQEVLKVAMVRYVVLGTNEFDRHPDGIVYGLASGLGFATVLTIDFVLRAGGVLPLASAIRAVDNALVHGALGAVSGYYIGRVKIDGKKLGWMAQGLAIVTVINGVYQVTSREATARLTFNPWYGLLAAVVLSIIVGFVLFAFFRRALKRATGELGTVSLQIHARSKQMPWDISARYDVLLIGALILALLVGWGIGSVRQGMMTTYEGEALPMTFRYPTGWAAEPGETGGVTVRDLMTAGLFKPTICITDEKVSSGLALDLLVAEHLANQEQLNMLYEIIARQTDMDVDGQGATRIEYRRVVDTNGGPAIINGVETYVLSGTRLYTFRYEAEPAAFEDGLKLYERLLRSAQLEH